MAPTQFIGGTTFDAATGEIRRADDVIRLEPQPALVLGLLIRRAGDLVTHDEIRRAVWGDDTHVDVRNGLHYCIRQIRAALGDRARASRFITTVPKRGYRLDAAVLTDAHPPDATIERSRAEERVPPSISRRPVSVRRRLTAAALIAGMGIGIAILERRPNSHHETAVAVLKQMHDLIY